MYVSSFCVALSLWALILVESLLLRREAIFTSACFFLTANVSHGTLVLALCLVGVHSAADSKWVWTKFSYSSFRVGTSMAAKIYNALLCNCIESKIEKILWKNQNDIRRNRSTTSQILTICRILGVRAKKPEATLLIVDFSKAFDSIHTGKME